MDTTQHYVCAGTCGGVAEAPKACEAASCTHVGMPLQECSCTDGSHTPETGAHTA